MKNPVILSSLIAAGLASLAQTAIAQDARIRAIEYDENRVVKLEGCFGFQTMVEFGPSEHVENVGLGDASRWLVVPNKRANILFVKPAFATSHSNMTVSTDRRSYAFELVARDTEACQRGITTYTLRFSYPDEQKPVGTAPPDSNDPPQPAAGTPAAPEHRNSAYTFSGERANIPQRVFDDGQHTYFRWSDGIATPAVYAVSADKSEALVSFRSQGDYLVADQIAGRYILRRGNAVAVLYNDSYQLPTLDQESPQPHAMVAVPSRALFARLFAKRDRSDVE